MRGRRTRFKPSLRDTMLASQRAQEFMAGAAPPEKREAAQAALESMAAAIPPAPKRRAVHEALDIDAIHKGKRNVPLESEVIHAVSQLLAVHPLVLEARRINSGMASYEAKSGKYAPVHFFKWLRCPGKMKMPDFAGFLIDGRPFGLEAKRPGWRWPTDDREREQEEYLAMLRRIGGIGAFVRSSAEAQAAIEGAALRSTP